MGPEKADRARITAHILLRLRKNIGDSKEITSVSLVAPIIDHGNARISSVTGGLNNFSECNFTSALVLRRYDGIGHSNLLNHHSRCIAAYGRNAANPRHQHAERGLCWE